MFDHTLDLQQATTTYSPAKRKQGFSLVELAIVLGILGLLLTGLFQLTTASTRQINNQITAQQLQQYIRAAKSYVIAAKSDPQGTVFVSNGMTVNFPTENADYQDITLNLQAFKAGLPADAPNGGKYKAIMHRTANLASQASYVIVTSIVDGSSHDRVQLGNIATFTGAEGASIYSPAEVASNCGGRVANGIGAFGGVCYNLDNFPLQTDRPASLSFLNIYDIASNDSNYLWRVTATGDKNKMQHDLGMLPSYSMVFDGLGDIRMNGATALGDPKGGIATNGGNVYTRGGQMQTAGGEILTGGGTIDLGDSLLIGARSVVFADVNGRTPTIQVGTDADFGTTTLGITNTDVRLIGTLRASNLQADSFVYVSSDERLKENIRQLSQPLDTLLKIRGVSYRLKKSQDPSDGVIAQEVEAIYPELVKTDAKGYKQVNYNGLIGPLIESIRELKQRNDELTLRVEQLEKKQGN